MKRIREVEMRTEYRHTPMGMDEPNPRFSWKLETKEQGACQRAYEILVWKEEVDGTKVICWDSGKTDSDESAFIPYAGEALRSCTRYFWRVRVWDEKQKEVESEISWFETGLMGTTSSVWKDAHWIGMDKKGINTAALSRYLYELEFQVDRGNKAGIVLAARNKDNYVLFEFDMDGRRLMAYEYCDNAWNGSQEMGVKKTVKVLGAAGGYRIPEKAVPLGGEYEIQKISFLVRDRAVTVTMNGAALLTEEILLPENPGNQPRKAFLMSLGFRQENSRAVFGNLMIQNTETGDIYQQETFKNHAGALTQLGEVKNGRLVVENRFELACPVPGFAVKKSFVLKEEKHHLISARLYASARGFYEVYLNGSRLGEEYLSPGFTDYRIQIPYQTYDVTEVLSKGHNTLVALVGKGYYSGYCGYCGPMKYGEENSFIGMLVLTYKDGHQCRIKTDESWMYAEKTPLIDSDYLDGETYDARLEEALFATKYHEIWRPCGIKAWTEKVIPTNGTLKEPVPFELVGQMEQGARLERILKPVQVIENPKGHFVYDFGQNMVGTIRLKVKAERGRSYKIRYGEMSYQNGEIYIMNIRTAANTDIYICKGSEEGETFIPAFTSHGFRYVEITGNGRELKDRSELLSLEGMVLCNVKEKTGSFTCSNPLINQLQSNIEWGQRGNYLLVPTDCPQRNERMGWTGDAQVFAGTAAFNMDVYAFTRKWLRDVRDGQLLYNKKGAVPDTAPMGGDNRLDGCAGWADAAVIVPWELYLEYGDKRILEENYDMMAKWIAYQSLEERQDYGLRKVDGKEVPEQSDLAGIPYIQTQQRRGDHLTFDESTPFILSATAYAAGVAKMMAGIAEILDKKEDAAAYEKRFRLVRQAFQEAWVQEDGSLAYWGEMSKSNPDDQGSIINQTYYSNAPGNPHHPSQTAYALAIDFGLIPEGKMEGAKKGLAQAMADRDNHISAGFLGISHINPALTKAGLWDMAFALLEQEGNPGWLYSVKNGATTIWERWNSYTAETGAFGDISMNSFNHYSYGAVGEWMYQNILGIQMEKENGKNAYKHLILAPVTGGHLTFAKGSHESVYGTIESEWRIEGNKILYHFEVPVSCSAKIILPAGAEAVNRDGIYHAAQQEDKMIFDTGSGSYEFTCQIK